MNFPGNTPLIIVIIDMPSSQCVICGFVAPGIKARSCELCEMSYHQICYFLKPEARKLQECDACGHVMEQKQGRKPKMEPQCFICCRNDGVLKEITADKFAHVMCVLTSNSMMIESYASFQVKQKTKSATGTCKQCKEKSPHLIQCQFCDFRSHYNCLKQEQYFVGQFLQGNLKHNKLLEAIEVPKQLQDIVDIIYSCLPEWKKKPAAFNPLAMCPNETKKYCWCFCGRPELNDEKKNPSIMCDGCNRFVHMSCSKLKNLDENQAYFCEGCGVGDIYRKNARLPDLIKQATRIESLGPKITLADIKWLDAFPYIYSRRLLAVISQEKPKIINYMAIKAIHELVSAQNRSTENLQKLFKLVGITLGTAESKNKQNKQLWASYCQMLKRLDPNHSYSTNLVIPSSAAMVSDSKQIEQKIYEHMEKCKQMLDDNPRLQIPNINYYICIVRQLIRQAPRVREQIEQHMGDSVLLALLLFKSSSSFEEAIVEKVLTVLFHNCKKITNKQLQQLEALKKKRCPNFTVEKAWEVIVSSMQIVNETTKGEAEQSKIEKSEPGLQSEARVVLQKVMQSRQLNPKLFGVLKKRVACMEKLGAKQKKIKLLYQWSILSKKVYFGLEKKKMSVCGIAEAFKQMKKSEYPDNALRRRLEVLFEYVIKIRKLLYKIQSAIALGQQHGNESEFFSMMKKPSLLQAKQAIHLINQAKYPEVWADLQKFQLQEQVNTYEELYFRAKQVLGGDSLQYNQANQQQALTKKHQKTNQPKFNSHLKLRKQLTESPLCILSPDEHYQIFLLAARAEVEQKNAKWAAQKAQESENEKELLIIVSQIIEQLSNQHPQKQIKLETILVNPELEKQVLDILEKLDRNRQDYFQKHIKRNKKWVEDMKNLEKGLLKSITYQDLCCIEFKLQNSIFNHNRLIEQIIVPIKTECEQMTHYLQQIIPYCQHLRFNLSLKQNIYSPQSKFYKQVKQLRVKDYTLNLYDQDCQFLKRMAQIYQRITKKGKKQDLLSCIDQFEEAYKQFSAYIYTIKNTWDIITKICERTVKLYEDSKSEREPEENSQIFRRKVKILKNLEKVAQVIQVPEYRSRMQQLVKEIQGINS